MSSNQIILRGEVENRGEESKNKEIKKRERAGAPLLSSKNSRGHLLSLEDAPFEPEGVPNFDYRNTHQ